MVDRKTAIKTVKSFIADCMQNGLTFDKVLIFGSIANGEIHSWSDIDLMLFSNQFSDNIFENLKLYSKINIRYPIIETHPYHTKYLYSQDPFIEKMSKNSIEVR